jgi:UDP-N-acetylglucosamine enolpyruvyl transferase
MLNRMGAKIRGAGSPRITIDGVEALGGCEHRVMPDRIVAGTYAIAAAMTNGDVTIDDFPYDSLLAAVNHLEEVGVHVTKVNPNDEDARCSVRISSNRVLRPTIITTQPHPGFPTDLQAQFMALLSIADGNSIITEKIYTERFLHVAELSRMGAQVYRQGSTAVTCVQARAWSWRRSPLRARPRSAASTTSIVDTRGWSACWLRWARILSVARRRRPSLQRMRCRRCFHRSVEQV